MLYPQKHISSLSSDAMIHSSYPALQRQASPLGSALPCRRASPSIAQLHPRHGSLGAQPFQPKKRKITFSDAPTSPSLLRLTWLPRAATRLQIVYIRGA